MSQPQSGTGGAVRGTGLAFAYVTSLFFAWGFATSLIDPLIAAVRRVFDLSYTESFLTTFAWFIAYGVASLPAAAVLTRLGYSRSIIAALLTMVLGCLIVPVATIIDFYPGILLALFVIASGVTLLQVAANPLVAELGTKKSSHFRLVFSQAFNSLGATVGPWLGAHVLLTGGVFAAGAVVTVATRGESLRSIDIAFLGMGAFFALIAAFIFSARKQINAAAPAHDAAEPVGAAAILSALKSRWALFGALAIFIYVGSEVAIGNMLTNFLSGPDILNIPVHEAGKMVALYWGGAMVGRFIGSWLLTRIHAGVLLSICTVVAATLCLIVTQTGGVTAAYAALAVGFFNSIMFPSIFTLTLERSSAPAAATSGLLVFGIIGGALLPLLAAQVADRSGDIHLGFFVPVAGYLLLTVFAIVCARTKGRDSEGPVASPH
ncbi:MULTISPECIES: sugar MFS transporter [unclassified Brevundimonas]|uniref:sugar MFS transporter n=1 Tax=unclassified Brevundimonas TaxID=2622653 RepID=UPI000CFD11DF|nr:MULTISPECIES: sugar MFS transporter [unclassified Brevundimonas]PRA27775.1 glucose/galactose MFS transporter [Brevundimonas sp. MYb27]PQZ81064.1 glucose/galactose MFS transporter [Brevundimonas sp. MYb31]PRB15369.1 glucose/galactose MFS transporter [Brevundimonas sp. MYb52]PRB35708.1 glucose/galactose MFS transporter [Brevundimonas sp. MYb46]PRB42793.1 glucose/galactose MFS transporter [Brevundimonas sp. MYb33]